MNFKIGYDTINPDQVTSFKVETSLWIRASVSATVILMIGVAISLVAGGYPIAEVVVGTFFGVIFVRILAGTFAKNNQQLTVNLSSGKRLRSGGSTFERATQKENELKKLIAQSNLAKHTK